MTTTNSKKGVEIIKGFSKLSKEAKIEWLLENYFENKEEARDTLQKYWPGEPHMNEAYVYMYTDIRAVDIYCVDAS